MDILIDTHILIWFQEGNEQLDNNRLSLLTDTENQIFVSQISLMELAIKYKLNKLPAFIVDVATVIRQIKIDDFSILPIKDSHVVNYQNIPLYDSHRDPFDRFLVAIAQSKNLALMTSDSKFEHYKDFLHII
ncbi:type II toxin-antitoxin system VapC family toxin [Runella aurantiaca]|uniref:Type II toxin-antitoxin system VapC family toxin n=1 Tax=Runella aurantiaca TaxID=2282308 RepID=A0A369I889_9BACT|nr:type II toxin-antitoxin system VapC family toxin [Runella aurantiaca]RDB04465.1 type II toxin-antitoxin system VapC family toxin [Runella aurantiaca]